MNVGPNIIKDSLIFYIDVNNIKKYNGVGNIGNLVSNNEVIVENGAFYEEDSISFDGSNDRAYLDYGTVSDLSNMTISYFLKADAIQSGDKKLVAVSESFNTELKDGKPLTYFFNGSWRTFDYNVAVTVGVWYHYTWVYDTGVAKLFIDGDLVLQETITGGNLISSGGGNKITIGSRWTGSSWIEFFNGNLNLIMVYESSLTDDEVYRNYDALKSKY